MAWADLAIAGGQRVSPADAYLRPALDRPNLTVQTGCLVTGLQRAATAAAPASATCATGHRPRRTRPAR